MIYKPFKDLKLSALGMGTMRLPTTGGDDAQIDAAATQEMVDYALSHGVNYFDTAWGYHSGNSELIMGEALKQHPRENFYLATKFPGYDLANMPKVKEIFSQQLERLQTDYFDFYLIHNVNEMNIDAYLKEEEYGIYSHLLEQKKAGKIRHLGFSAHGSVEVMRRFLEAYHEGMEFCQIQLNYIDWTLQDAQAKMELLREYDIPVWVMEPVRGGRLAKLSEKDEQTLAALRPQEKPVAWAFRFLQSMPEVVVTLSGMSDLEQMKENIAIFEEEKPLTDSEMNSLLHMAAGMMDGLVPCTACRYCVAHCPKGLDIPKLIGLYNDLKFTGGGFIPRMVVGTLPEDKKPSACVGCHSCEKLCPQQIKISEVMTDFTDKLK
ncbi:oxidoreductase [Acutalibacter sp. 1XD8-33]|uniref:aldo/keto reductase n=1 Tax=Acutalibacter sp. 1XD8-33 TaxID=2320081 RepID=UPI000EA0991E|nr:aldo/keto reductase [Acutalibacter sp. 1XD8-33]RKJ41822.1 oxidoreductase [Acutalibacter sp. 1XD8-33]